MTALPVEKHAEILRFGRFELDLERQELRRGGVLLRLAPQPYRILLMLLEREGDLVTREEIRQALWGGETFVDFEQGINTAVRQIRHILADHAEAPLYVQTVPRRGYRFVAIVERIERVPAYAAIERHEAPVAMRTRRAPMLLVVALTLFVARGPNVVSVPAAPLVITVDAFRPLSPAAAADAQAFTAELRALLVKVQPQRIRIAPGGAVAIEGLVQRSGSSLRVIVSATNRRTQTQLWSETFDRPLDRSSGMEIAVAHQVAATVARRYLPPGRHEPRLTSRVPQEARGLYVAARKERARSAKSSDARCEALLRRAIAIAPRFAEAWSALADLRGEQMLYGPGVDRAELAKEVLAYADRALALQPTLAEARSARALVHFQWQYDFDAADRELRRAIADDPDYADAHLNLAMLSSARGRHDEALAQWTQARALDPVEYDLTTAEGLLLFRARRNEDALAALREILAVRPDDPAALWTSIAILIRARRWSEASTLVRAYAGSVDDTPVHSKEEFLTVFRLLDPSRETRPGRYRMALLDAELGDFDRAIGGLQLAARDRVPSLAYARVDPALDGLRGDARFAAILRSVGL